MPEQCERHAPAGLVLAVDAGRFLVDTHDGADARLQVAILETDAIADAEVLAGGALGGLGGWHRRCSPAVGGELDRRVGQRPDRTGGVVLHGDLGVLHRHHGAAAQLQQRSARCFPVDEAHPLPQMQMLPDLHDPRRIRHQALDYGRQVEQLERARAVEGFEGGRIHQGVGF